MICGMLTLAGKRETLLGSTGSAATFIQIESWLRECTQGHASCAVDRGEWFLPSRLIDVTSWHKDRMVRLVESKNIDQTHSKPPLYTTLSHRWTSGSTAAASTTTKNFASRLQALSASALLLHFLHVIEATHKLNILYLWIDSLCILQGSKEDFDHEAPLMSKIYRFSHCTISADVQDTDELGLFRCQDTENNVVEFEIRDETGSPRKVRAVKEQISGHTAIEESPLEQRGWYV